MLPREVLRQVRRLQLRARRAVESLFGGAYHSAFKGAGLAFDEVREYQPGDDVRAIDWNVTARAGHPFVKRFIEERELTVILAVDVSDSQGFGTRLQSKRQVVSAAATSRGRLVYSLRSLSFWLHRSLTLDKVELRPFAKTHHAIPLIGEGEGE